MEPTAIHEAAREAALSFLDRRGYAKAELLARLIRRGHDEPVAQEAISDLARAGRIDDHRYAASLAEEILAVGPGSSAFLAARLTGRGIPEGVAREVADDTLATMDLVEVATAFAIRKLGPRPTGGPAAARRIAAALARRGLDQDTIGLVLDRVREQSGIPVRLETQE